jgi:hypothetical protein
LAVCLVLLIVPVAWLLWPASEQELFAKAEQLMASDDRDRWQEAKNDYLKPLLRRFPDGEHAAAAQGYLDRI